MNFWLSKSSAPYLNTPMLKEYQKRQALTPTVGAIALRPEKATNMNSRYVLAVKRFESSRFLHVRQNQNNKNITAFYRPLQKTLRFPLRLATSPTAGPLWASH
jgi:hypothetical protein